MENAEVAKIFAELADLMELTGGNPYKVRAYRQAAQVIDTLPGPVSELWRRGELTVDFRRSASASRRGSASSSRRERWRIATSWRRACPPGVVELLSVEGVGPKTVAAAWRTLGVTDLEALEQACRTGRLSELPRMGERRAQAILEAIQRYRARRTTRMPLHRAVFYADSICAKLRKVPGVQQGRGGGERAAPEGDRRRPRRPRRGHRARRRRCAAFCDLAEVADGAREGAHQGDRPPARRPAGGPARAAARVVRRSPPLLHRQQGSTTSPSARAPCTAASS